MGIVVQVVEDVEAEAGRGFDPGTGRTDGGTGEGDPTEDLAEGASDPHAAEDQRWVMVSVSDEGPGIHPQDLERIFSEFEQLDTAARQRGTGLGLTLCRNLAHHLGGTIQVRSEVGRGSTFSLWLPAGGEYQAREGWIG